MLLASLWWNGDASTCSVHYLVFGAQVNRAVCESARARIVRKHREEEASRSSTAEELLSLLML